MWTLEALKKGYEGMKSGDWDQFSLENVEALAKYHASQVVLNTDSLTEKQQRKAIMAVNEISEYYDKRLKGTQAKSTQPTGDAKQSPTELYKAMYGVNPTDAYRQQFGTFDKKEYGKWLLSSVKQQAKVS